MATPINKKRYKSPRIDLAELNRVLESQGVQAALERWPSKHLRGRIVRIARFRGFLPKYAHSSHEPWNPAWVALLGTKPDVELATELGVSHSLIGAARSELCIPPFERVSKRAAQLARLSALTNEQLSEPIHVVAESIGISPHFVTLERQRRGIRISRGRPLGADDYSTSLRRAAVAGIFAAHPETTLQEVGNLLGVSRERVRQLRESVDARLREAAALERSREPQHDAVHDTASKSDLPPIDPALAARTHQT